MTGDKILTKAQIDWLKLNYSLLGAQICSEHLNIKVPYIRKIASAYSLKANPEIISKNNSKKAIQKAQIQDDIRIKNSEKITINTPHLAYALGYLWGDGTLRYQKHTKCIYVNIEIVKSDFESVYDKSFLKMGKWSLHYRQRGNRQEQICATLCDSEWGLFLHNNKYGQKSHISPNMILSNIHESLHSHWWRGYSDADGCFYTKKTTNQFSMSGTYDQDWSELEKIMNNLSIRYAIRRREQICKFANSISKSSILIVSNREGCVKFGEYIYAGNTICLKRKFEKFRQMCR